MCQSGRAEELQPIHFLVARLLVSVTVLVAPVLAQESKPNAPGTMVDIGGYKLYLDCRGKGGA
ncbi:MAG: hypothetical protein DMG39_21260, partial [Acidobacteria bacterium]